MIARAYRIYSPTSISPLFAIEPDALLHKARRGHNHIQYFACHLHGYRRKWHGATVQECRYNARPRYGSKEYLLCTCDRLVLRLLCRPFF